MKSAALLVLLCVGAVAAQSCIKPRSKWEDPCTRDGANFNPEAPYCENGLLCLDDLFNPCVGDDICTCQAPFREEGYNDCTTTSCEDGHCCEAGLYCTRWDTTPDLLCVKEGGSGDACETDDHCKRGFLCNLEDPVAEVMGECTAVMSVGVNEPADHPYLCKWGLVLLTGEAQHICVEPFQVACTPNQQRPASDTSGGICGRSTATTIGNALNPFDSFDQRLDGYCCNEDSQCEFHTKKCANLMKSVITKNSGGPRNENGLPWKTTTDKEHCALLKCSMDVYDSLANGMDMQCDDTLSGSASSGSSDDTAVAGAVVGTAAACGAIGGAVYYKSTQL